MSVRKRGYTCEEDRGEGTGHTSTKLDFEWNLAI